MFYGISYICLLFITLSFISTKKFVYELQFHFFNCTLEIQLKKFLFRCMTIINSILYIKRIHFKF